MHRAAGGDQPGIRRYPQAHGIPRQIGGEALGDTLAGSTKRPPRGQHAVGFFRVSAGEIPARVECSSVASSSYCPNSATAPICRIRPNWSSTVHDSAILPPSMR
jgi:hypothetical protein